MGTFSEGTAEQGVAETLEEQGVVETLEEQGKWRPRRSWDPKQAWTSRLWAWSTSRSDSFVSSEASGPFFRSGLPGATGPTKIKIQSQLGSRRALCY